MPFLRRSLMRADELAARNALRPSASLRTQCQAPPLTCGRLPWAEIPGEFRSGPGSGRYPLHQVGFLLLCAAVGRAREVRSWRGNRGWRRCETGAPGGHGQGREPSWRWPFACSSAVNRAARRRAISVRPASRTRSDSRAVISASADPTGAAGAAASAPLGRAAPPRGSVSPTARRAAPT